MSPIKQTLCRLWLAQASRACAWLSLVVCLGHLGWAGPANAQQESRERLSTPKDQLIQSVTQWVGRQQGLGPEEIQLQPLDPRLKVQACARPLNIDWPFSSTETVRVRCPEPGWSLYIRVLSTVPTARPTWGTPAAPAPAGEQRRPVLVTVNHLTRGMTLQAQDVQLSPMVLPAGAGAFVENPAEVIHAEVLRDLPAGTPLRRTDLRPSILVKRGQLVQLTVGQRTGFMVSARVEALQDGRMGEQIKLKNPESGRVLSGVVKGPNAVEGL